MTFHLFKGKFRLKDAENGGTFDPRFGPFSNDVLPHQLQLHQFNLVLETPSNIK